MAVHAPSLTAQTHHVTTKATQSQDTGVLAEIEISENGSLGDGFCQTVGTTAYTKMQPTRWQKIARFGDAVVSKVNTRQRAVGADHFG